jgi:hypothetical protein
LAIQIAMLGLLPAFPVMAADITFFDTGSPDGKMATATRPDGPGKTEIESADDFILARHTSITGATFTGLIPSGASATHVVVEIYQVFPALSDVGRTSGAGTTPPFITDKVPTRLNSPSDVELDGRDSATSGDLTFSMGTVAATFDAANSVLPGGIHAKPAQTTGGNGKVTGEEEVQFSVTFTTPFDLPADHYFFVPQVQLDTGDFLWLSAPKPITGGTGPFSGDLQTWTRDAALDPDWLRVGTDIVGGTTPPTFNAAFSLSGSVVPEPSTWAMMALGFVGLGLVGYWSRRTRGDALA